MQPLPTFLLETAASGFACLFLIWVVYLGYVALGGGH